MSDAPLSPIQAPPEAQQIDLPEAKWTYRRWFTFLVCVALLLLLAWMVRLMPADQLRAPFFVVCGMFVLQQVLYMVGPTAEHLKGLAAAVDIQRFMGLRGPQP